jgi:hypothetical protein
VQLRSATVSIACRSRQDARGGRSPLFRDASNDLTAVHDHITSIVASSILGDRSLPTTVAIASAPGKMPRGLVRLPFTDGTITRSCEPIIHAPRHIRFSIS